VILHNTAMHNMIISVFFSGRQTHLVSARVSVIPTFSVADDHIMTSRRDRSSVFTDWATTTIASLNPVSFNKLCKKGRLVRSM